MGAKLSLAYFRDENPDYTITIEGIFTDIEAGDIEILGQPCVHTDPEYGDIIKVKFEWSEPDEAGKKFTFDGVQGRYVPKGAGGWDSLLQSRIPAPLRIKPTNSPGDLEAIVTEILTSAVKQKIKEDDSHVQSLLDQVRELTDQFANEIQSDIDAACTSITSKLQNVFPNYSVQLIPEGKLEAEKIIGAGSHIRLIEKGRQALPLKHQGSGLQRTFLWSAISALSEIGKMKKGKKEIAADKPRILLIDEPEAFLHPQSIRAAREALYSLSEVDNWQVMASTHSPVFIDVSKPHTTIIRLERDQCHTAKVVSTNKLHFSDEERERLGMIRSCHPTVNEFFFADTVILVEGETEHLVFTMLLKDAGVNNYQVVNCLGKGNIQLFAKILNHFHLKYIAVHDSDSPKAKRQSNWINNPAWTINQNILEVTLNNPKGAYCIAQVPDFEGYYFEEKFKSDKPYSAYSILTSDEFKTSPVYERLRQFVRHIQEDNHPNRYTDLTELTKKVAQWVTLKNPAPQEMWEINS